MVNSPRLSFKGYSFPKALYRNKDIVKALLLFIVGYGYFQGFVLSAFLSGLGMSTAALAGKLVLDAFDYYFSEVELQ